MSQTGQLHACISVCICPCIATDSQRVRYKPKKPTQISNPFFAAWCVYFSLILISLSLCCLILSHALLFHQLPFLIFPFYIQPQTTGICVVWWVKMPISLEGLDGLYMHIKRLFKSSSSPVSCPTDPLIALQPCCAVSSCPSTSPLLPPLLGEDGRETVLKLG